MREIAASLLIGIAAGLILFTAAAACIAMAALLGVPG